MPHFVLLTSQISLTQSINQQKSIKNDQLPKYSRYQGPAMKYLLKLLESEDTKFHLVAFVSLFSTVHYQMCPQSTCMRGCKITQVAFVCLFSSVSLHMSPQRTWVSACKVALVAFVCLFSIVCFQMCPQIACMRRCIITQVAFV